MWSVSAVKGSVAAQVLERCMMEALRLFPPLIMLLRQAKAPFAVTTSQGKTYVIPKVSALAAARLPFWAPFPLDHSSPTNPSRAHSSFKSTKQFCSIHQHLRAGNLTRCVPASHATI